jgi:signal transduction histidine kinase
MPAPLKAQRCALAICIGLFGAFCALAPFARISLPRIEAFIPIYDSTFALNNLVTAGFLLVGFTRSRLRVVLVLASGYLFTSLLAPAHMLAFPGVFSSTGLLGAGPQSSAWLQIVRYGGFPLFVIGYALLKRREALSGPFSADAHAHFVSASVGAVAGVCLLTLLSTVGHQLMPRIMNGDGYTTAMTAVSMLVLLVAWVLGIALGVVINKGRFDAGFYAGGLYGLFAASVVPIVFFIEAARFWSRLDEARAIAEESNAELARAQEELVQAKRLEAIGQLTGGVAHDFNNLLTVVIGNLDLISEARGDPEKIERLAHSAMLAARRGEHLVCLKTSILWDDGGSGHKPAPP